MCNKCDLPVSVTLAYFSGTPTKPENPSAGFCGPKSQKTNYKSEGFTEIRRRGGTKNNGLHEKPAVKLAILAKSVIFKIYKKYLLSFM